jgi:hypothetical protein
MYKPHMHDNPKHPFFTFEKFACPLIVYKLQQKCSIHSKTLTLKTANRSTHKPNTTLRKVKNKIKWMTQKYK